MYIRMYIRILCLYLCKDYAYVLLCRELEGEFHEKRVHDAFALMADLVNSHFTETNEPHQTGKPVENATYTIWQQGGTHKQQPSGLYAGA